ncbi:Hypothetical protein P9303_11321 [Prochlorococcus marinus str. MIT 9303]|uniref:Uncharacterized protein n=1 Tax=Prochlorococcus marinus (strain MIT 9303) TaxID=59922 RepID=A2C8S1_PROM3|nr:Hypothetical protein P9303_11321 [Prochlorococcus marinus str. MIT 9303]
MTVDGTASQKTTVLVTQATALGPERVNLNASFEGL